MKFRCPKCSTGFESEPVAGGIVECLNCHAKLKVPNPAATPKAVAAVVRKPATEVRATDEEDEPEEERTRLRKSRKKKKTKSAGPFAFSFVGAAVVIFAVLNLYGRLTKDDDMAARLRDPNNVPPNKKSVGPLPIAAPPTNFPELPAATVQSGGLRVHAASVSWGGNRKTDVKIYLPPKEAPAKSLPAVFIAPAGSTCMCGQSLGESDTPEHLPWVKAGLAVVAYSLSGPMPDPPNEQLMKKAITDFLQADAGLVDAKAAMDFALLRVGEIDANKLYAAGHSSAGSFALTFAAREPRLKGVVAFAAAIDLEERFAPLVAQTKNDSEFVAFFAKLNPRANESKLSCPVFLFHAADDDNVPIRDAENCERRLKQLGKNVTFVRTNRGGHYQSMIDEGIPAAIAWVKSKAGM